MNLLEYLQSEVLNLIIVDNTTLSKDREVTVKCTKTLKSGIIAEFMDSGAVISKGEIDLTKFELMKYYNPVIGFILLQSQEEIKGIVITSIKENGVEVLT